jgi:hypothetical protein
MSVKYEEYCLLLGYDPLGEGTATQLARQVPNSWRMARLEPCFTSGDARFDN